MAQITFEMLEAILGIIVACFEIVVIYLSMISNKKAQKECEPSVRTRRLTIDFEHKFVFKFNA